MHLAFFQAVAAALEGSHLELWLALLTQTSIMVVASVKYILRVERRLMAIELVLKIKNRDNGRTGETQL